MILTNLGDLVASSSNVVTFDVGMALFPPTFLMARYWWGDEVVEVGQEGR